MKRGVGVQEETEQKLHLWMGTMDEENGGWGKGRGWGGKLVEGGGNEEPL